MTLTVTFEFEGFVCERAGKEWIVRRADEEIHRLPPWDPHTVMTWLNGFQVGEAHAARKEAEAVTELRHALTPGGRS